MASTSSSSSIMVSSGPNPSRYDVFLSFRGKDTRDRFTDHLYHALRREGINPFRDDDDFGNGQELKPEIERGIKESKASIVVLSENYADSTWCLDELCLILKQKRDCNHFVLPVFYDVEPSDVRKHLKTFAIKAKPSTSGRWTEDNVTRWKAALEEVGSLKGKVASGYRPETKLLAVIVDAIHENVDLKQHSLPPNLIGIDTQVKYINSWLMQSDDELFALYGMGGSGKTTLASYIFHSNCQKFQSTSFVENIGIRCKEHDRLEGLQEQLLNDILGGKNNKITNVGLGKSKIKEALQMKRALIVLDDIDELEQLEALLGTGEIKTQSKIMITTRIYKDEWFRSRSWRCRRYKMKLLGNDKSLELLSLHAFHSKIPKEGFEELAEQAIRYCDGNPLALEVLGSNLYEKNTIPLWKSELSFLEREINFKIQRVLVRSYNSLSSRNDKELFLHIACFFVGKDRDYVVKILEPDYSALSRINTLIDKNLLSVSPNNKLIMHRLIQEMGRTIVLEESPKDPAKRSRIWHSKDSYDVLEKGEGSNTVEGLALNMQMLREEKYAFEPSDIKAESLKNMDKLKLLHLKYVQLTGSYKNFSKDLRWFCWIGFNLQTMPSDLFTRNLVAVDMSYSKLKVFELPEVLQFLKILNLRDSLDLFQIRNLSRLPDLETLILWNCHSLVHVCETIKDLKSLTLLNMTACEKLFKMSRMTKFFNRIKLQVKASTFFGGSTQQHSFSLPRSLKWLFLKDCHLKLTDYFPLSFSKQLCLQYLDLGNSLFESLPDYRHLENLRVLDLSFCSKLKELLSLPSTLAELFTYYCESLEKITFQSHRFTLQEVGYAGCINLSEIQGFIKLVPIAKLDETDMGHMKWLREYENKEVCLAGDDELTIGRSRHAQMLYEFNIMSTSLPDIKDPNMRPDCISKSPLLSFDVPVCPKNRRLKGLNVSFKYTISGEDLVWFSKIRTANGVDLMYNPKVFGKPGTGEVGIWLSYWPIGNRLNAGDKVNVSICVMSGLEVLECGASLVYTDDEETEETSKNNMDWVGLSGFQLSTGGYYLCRRDFFELMEVDRLTRDWFKILVDGTIDDTEIQGWRKTGRPQQLHPLDTELKAVRCIIHGPESEEIYKIAKMSKSSFVDSMELISSTLGETMKSATTSKFSDAATKPVGTVIIPEASVVDEIMELASSSPKDEMESSSEFSTLTTKWPQPCRHFEFAEIQLATDNFDESLVIGLGGFGKVYKGTIVDGASPVVAAIKRLDYGVAREFCAEVEMYSKMRHRHLVSLFGYCNHEGEMFLVYEYIPNGTLEDHLHKLRTPLSWLQRLKICIGAARGLEYLHTGMGLRVIHRDVQSSKILLHESWEAKISDFGLSWISREDQPTTHISTKVKGGFGYLDPNYFRTGILTMKSDVYAFGVVLFEVLCRKRAVDGSPDNEEWGLVGWVQESIKKGRLKHIIDSDMRDQISPRCLKGFVRIADRCLHEYPKKRPTIAEVLIALESVLALQESQ